MELKKDRNTAEMKERKKTTPDICFVNLEISGSLLAFFHLCLVSVLFSAPLILKWNEVLEKKFFPVENETSAFTPTVQWTSAWTMRLPEENVKDSQLREPQCPHNKVNSTTSVGIMFHSTVSLLRLQDTCCDRISYFYINIIVCGGCIYSEIPVSH